MPDNLSRLEEIGHRLARLERARSLALSRQDIGFWDHNLVTDELWWSPEMFHVFALTEQQWLAKGDGGMERFLACLCVVDRLSVAAAYQRAAEDPLAAYSYHFCAHGGDGTRRKVMGRGNFERDAAGRAVRCAGVCILMSESA